MGIVRLYQTVNAHVQDRPHLTVSNVLRTLQETAMAFENARKTGQVNFENSIMVNVILSALAAMVLLILIAKSVYQIPR